MPMSDHSEQLLRRDLMNRLRGSNQQLAAALRELRAERAKIAEFRQNRDRQYTADYIRSYSGQWEQNLRNVAATRLAELKAEREQLVERIASKHKKMLAVDRLALDSAWSRATRFLDRHNHQGDMYGAVLTLCDEGVEMRQACREYLPLYLRSRFPDIERSSRINGQVVNSLESIMNQIASYPKLSAEESAAYAEQAELKTGIYNATLAHNHIEYEAEGRGAWPSASLPGWGKGELIDISTGQVTSGQQGVVQHS